MTGTIPSGASRQTPGIKPGPLAWPGYRQSLFLEFLPGILHVREGLELHVGELAADPLHLAHVLVLDDVARLRVDRDRPARAVCVLVLPDQSHGAVGVDLAFLFADDVVDRVHRVPLAHGHEARRGLFAVLLLPGGNEGLVGGAGRRRRVVVHGDDADRHVAHVGQLLVRSEERRVGKEWRSRGGTASWTRKTKGTGCTAESRSTTCMT